MAVKTFSEFINESAVNTTWETIQFNSRNSKTDEFIDTDIDDILPSDSDWKNILFHIGPDEIEQYKSTLPDYCTEHDIVDACEVYLNQTGKPDMVIFDLVGNSGNGYIIRILAFGSLTPHGDKKTEELMDYFEQKRRELYD